MPVENTDECVNNKIVWKS